MRQVGAGFAGGDFEVQTIRGVGYRLSCAGADAPPDGANGEPRFGRRAVVAAAGAAAILGGAAFVQGRRRPVDRQAKELFERAEIARREEGCALIPEQASSLYRAALEAAPDFAAPWGGLALVAAKALDRNEDIERNRRVALSAARRGAEIDPRHPYPRIAVALAEPTYMRWGAQRKRLERLEQRIAPGWDLPAAIGFLAMCCGHLDTAIGAFQRALDHQWNLLGVQFWLAHALLMAGRDEESLRIADQALSQSPKNWCAWEVAFRANLMSGNFAAVNVLIGDVRATPANLHPGGRLSRQMLARAVIDEDAGSRKATIRYFHETILEWPSFIPFAAAPLALLREFELLTTAIRGYLLSEGPMAVPTDWRRHPWFLYQPPLLELHDHPPVRQAMLKVGLDLRR
ncbi:tetratricopeptide repeat protein [Tsuneonella sp. YG55]|uniref:Tetratricopeptide repeat protein n=1 Tax=Tsuneonella litorea TaxID=2976475 RepID=A0A9X2VZG1_9SPHN|nr:tetratricopeptide repeat protein [Tsuneonella litorea]MCT2558245.1 tetratricopeptide repeat protein [Tsuneonella litorea]